MKTVNRICALMLAAQVFLSLICGCAEQPADTDTGKPTGPVSILTGTEQTTDRPADPETQTDRTQPDSSSEPSDPVTDTSTETDSTEPATDTSVSDAQVFLTPVNSPVPIHTAEQAAYLAGPYDAISGSGGKAEKSYPEPLTLQWNVSMNGQSGFQHFTVRWGEKKDLSDAFSVDTSGMKTSIINLKAGTTYYWSVTAVFLNHSVSSPVETFTTEDGAPRNLKVSGVANVRDLGGWKTEDGKTVRQGMIYRTGRLNSDSSSKVEITESGKQTMLETLKVRTEIDLRGRNHETGNLSSSALGDGVRYYCLPTRSIAVIEEDKAEYTQIFHLLADEANYPVFFHCSVGADRTGKLAFLINGLLGVSEEDLLRDYLFTNFANVGGPRPLSKITSGGYVEVIRALPGDTLREKIYRYLTDAGIPPSDLDAVVRILKG